MESPPPPYLAARPIVVRLAALVGLLTLALVLVLTLVAVCVLMLAWLALLALGG